MVAVAIMSLLVITITAIIDPVEMLKRGRDERRVSDLTIIDNALAGYLVDHEALPDLATSAQDPILRRSDQLPAGNLALDSAASGWIDSDLSSYLPRMPIDPINDSTFHYEYSNNISTYELRALLEYDTVTMENDKGDDATYFELGNNLSLL